ncbi:MAG: helix-hairpin-helix domain-containing protein [Cytophagaceae bacterium]
MNVRPAKGTHGWTHRERNGYVLLCSLLFIPLATEFVFRSIPSKKESITNTVVVAASSDTTNEVCTIEHKKPIISEPKTSSKVLVDLNKADSISFLEVKGIGPVLAGRIVKYRNLLGGYVSIEQLKEVYGLKEENYTKIKTQVMITSSGIKKIEVDSLIRNPYGIYHPYWDKASKKELMMAKKRGVSQDSLIQMICSNKNNNWKVYLNR